MICKFFPKYFSLLWRLKFVFLSLGWTWTDYICSYFFNFVSEPGSSRWKWKSSILSLLHLPLLAIIMITYLQLWLPRYVCRFFSEFLSSMQQLFLMTYLCFACVSSEVGFESMNWLWTNLSAWLDRTDSFFKERAETPKPNLLLISLRTEPPARTVFFLKTRIPERTVVTLFFANF